ncbi:MAG: phosphatidate cytidylyltransferase [Methylotenera sp.]|nr:phosphatidate cytidylyltransferase [Methylotenera sp.]MSP99875.1 phosphatidate cytidylyltransferase [Methylotenera sp.]
MLKTRIITAIVLAIGFSAALFKASNMAWACITLTATMIAIWEWSHLIKLTKHQMMLNLASALSIGLMLLFASNLPLGHYKDEFEFSLLCLATVFWLGLAPVWLMLRSKINNKLIMAVLGLLLLLACWIALNGLQKISPWLLLAVLSTVWLADIAAYFAGKRFGQHKLAPEISPGKTWEGVAGAILATTLYGLLLCYYLHISRWLIVGLWLIVMLSIMGDLFESLLKRQAVKKDSSHLLPGHGGVLDRIDGLISTLPLVLFYIYFPLFANIQLYVR